MWCGFSWLIFAFTAPVSFKPSRGVGGSWNWRVRDPLHYSAKPLICDADADIKIKVIRREKIWWWGWWGQPLSHQWSLFCRQEQLEDSPQPSQTHDCVNTKQKSIGAKASSVSFHFRFVHPQGTILDCESHGQTTTDPSVSPCFDFLRRLEKFPLPPCSAVADIWWQN